MTFSADRRVLGKEFLVIVADDPVGDELRDLVVQITQRPEQGVIAR